MNPNTRSIAAAKRAEAVLTAYQKALNDACQLVEDLDCFPVESRQFQDLLQISRNLTAYSVEAVAIEEAVLDIAWEVTEAAKAAKTAA